MKQFKKQLLVAVIFAAAITPIFAKPDHLLGPKFDLRTFDMGEDYSGEVHSTLISRVPILESERAILYIHGYNDYFFQEHLADRLYDSAYNFYAIDLRKYGRSLTPSQTAFEVRDLKEYFQDIDSALMVIRGQGAKEIVLMGHSTGGLIASYYCGIQQDTPPVEGLILNSPFLDMNLGGGLMESVAVPVVSALGAWFPDFEVTGSSPSTYFESLHKDYHGEWNFDSTLKLQCSNPTTAGWIRAIHEGHKSVQGGYDLEIPILLLYSDKSFNGTDGWCAEYQNSDTVLDVEDIAKYGAKLGDKVTSVEIEDGMHDLILSSEKPREQTFSEIFEWLKQLQ